MYEYIVCFFDWTSLIYIYLFYKYCKINNKNQKDDDTFIYYLDCITV